MAGVVIDAEASLQARVVGMFIPQMPEELHCLCCRLQKAQRLRLQAEMQNPSGLLAQVINVLDTLENVVAHRLPLRVRLDQLLERSRPGADAPLDSRRH